MGVFREAVIEWDGKEYRFTPDMRLLRNIEREVSIMEVAHSASKGTPRASHMAFIIASVMRHAGISVTDDEICAELMVGDAKKAYALYEVVLEAISPAVSEKKPKAQSA